jgi:predicted phage tail protein
MKVVKVYGPLRKYLGQCRFEFVADTPAQAMKALCVNFPGLAQWLLDREAEGMAFRVTRGRDKITNEAPEGLVLPWSEREVFSIAPVIVGAGRGVGKFLAGIALIAWHSNFGCLALAATGLLLRLLAGCAIGAGTAAAAGI